MNKQDLKKLDEILNKHSITNEVYKGNRLKIFLHTSSMFVFMNVLFYLFNKDNMLLLSDFQISVFIISIYIGIMSLSVAIFFIFLDRYVIKGGKKKK